MPVKAVLTFTIFAVSMGSSYVRAQDVSNVDAPRLATILFAEEKLPTVQLRGRFEFFSAYEKGSLEPSSSANFTGEIDLRNATTHFDFQNYKSPVYGSKEPTQHDAYSVTFDGKKWVVIDSGSKTHTLPQGLVGMAEISLERPHLFLKSLDHLCFPLFASLLNVQIGGNHQASLKDVLGGKMAAKVSTRVEDASLILTVLQEGVTDEFTFDSSKGYVLTRRRTDFGNKTNPTDNQIINDLVVAQFVQVGDRWLPQTAEFTQTVNDKVEVKRTYRIGEATVIPNAKPIEAVIPMNTYVTDQINGTSYRSGAVSPSPTPR